MSIPSENTHNLESTTALVRAELGSVPSGDQTRDEIAAELADHLAASAAAARVRGLNEQQANAEATRRFGDVAAILRQCWWIKQGENVMFRTAAIVLLSVCVIGLFAVAYSAWRIEASFSDQMGELSGELASLNQTQQQLLANMAPDEPAPVKQQITGKLYLGDPSVPAYRAVLLILDGPTLDPVRELQTNEMGEFETGILPPGEYYVYAPLIGPKNQPVKVTRGTGYGNDVEETHMQYHVQSAPIEITPGCDPISCSLDLQLLAGMATLEFDPELTTALANSSGLGAFPLRINFELSHDYRALPTSKGRQANADQEFNAAEFWPARGFVFWNAPKVGTPDYFVRGMLGGRPPVAHDLQGSYPLVSLRGNSFVPIGTYKLRALIGPDFSSALDHDGRNYNPPPEAVKQAAEQLAAERKTWAKNQWPEFPQPEFTFEVRPDQHTRLRLVMPEGYLEKLSKVLSREELDADEIVRECALQPVAIRLIGYEDL